MADHRRHQYTADSLNNAVRDKSPSSSGTLTLFALLPVGVVLLFLAGITLAGTLIGLMVTAPLFLLFSPIIIPAALSFLFALTGFLSSGAFGITAISSLSWIINYFRRMRNKSSRNLEYGKRHVQDSTDHLTRKPMDAGQWAQEGVST